MKNPEMTLVAITPVVKKGSKSLKMNHVMILVVKNLEKC